MALGFLLALTLGALMGTRSAPPAGVSIGVTVGSQLQQNPPNQ